MIQADILVYVNAESVLSDIFCRHGCSVTCWHVTYKWMCFGIFDYRLGAICEGTSWRQFLLVPTLSHCSIQLSHVAARELLFLSQVIGA
jgi:hypothetical protein